MHLVGCTIRTSNNFKKAREHNTNQKQIVQRPGAEKLNAEKYIKEGNN